MIVIVNLAITLATLAFLAVNWIGIVSGLFSAAIVITFIVATVYERRDMRRERDRSA